MKSLVLFICSFALLSHNGYSQNNEGQFWIETGLKTKISENLSVNAELNNRFANNGLKTSYTQLSVKYKLLKWISASIDYRIVSKKQENTNYIHSNRINTNINGSYKLNRLYGSVRVRYQYAFGRLFGSEYEPDFDNAIRFRPKIKYDINNSIFTPHFSVEFYYNPNNSPLGKRYNKIRSSLGVELELEGPHDIGAQFIYDKKINLPAPTNYLIFKLSYTYKLSLVKKSGRR